MEGVVLINNFNELFDISMMDSEFVQLSNVQWTILSHYCHVSDAILVSSRRRANGP